MGPLYQAFEGYIVLPGYAPDGDSIRFLPAPADFPRLHSLRHGALLATSRTDGSVQVRLEAIDAPELHYEGAEQPRGARARDALLAWLSVDPTAVRYAFDGATITSATPARVPVTLLADDVDRHGRVIGYLLRAGALGRERRALRRRVDPHVLRCTANCAMLEAGHSYLLAYTSLPGTHSAFFRGVARAARRARRGVWRDDATARGFALHRGKRSLGPEGALVYPKLFRRCIDYLARRHISGYRGCFVDWLRSYGARGVAVPERVCVRHTANVPFASLVRDQADRISIAADLNDLVFVDS